MFKLIIWFMKTVLELAAVLVFCAGLLAGPQLALIVGFDGNAIAEILLGAAAGATAASVLFGIPIVIISMHQHLAKTVELLAKLEKNSRSAGFANGPVANEPRAETTQAAAA